MKKFAIMLMSLLSAGVVYAEKARWEKVGGVSVASYNPESDPSGKKNLGPEGNFLPDKLNCIYVRIPANKKVTLTMSCAPAFFENVLQVHDSVYLLQMECANYGTSGNRTSSAKQFDAQATDYTLIVSGWTKGSPPKGRIPWGRMPKHRVQVAEDGATLIGFEDSPNNSTQEFQDATVIIKLID